MKRCNGRISRWFLVLVILAVTGPSAALAANFYRENRNGKVFVLQVDPVTRTETVYNHEKAPLFLAPGAKRLAVLPTAGWGDYTNNSVPSGSPTGGGEIAGDINGIVNLRLINEGGGSVRFDIYRGPNKLLTSLRDTKHANWYLTDAVPYDIAVSQYMGPMVSGQNAKNTLRVYLFLGSYGNPNNPAIFRFDFLNDSLTSYGFKARLTPSDGGSPPYNTVSSFNWRNVEESGDINVAKAIDVNCKSPTDDLLIYQPTRTYSLQHVWTPQANNGFSWGINYLMSNNRVMKANTPTPVSTNIAQMHQIFDVGVDLGDAFTDTLLYYRTYYNHGNTFVANNVNTNTSLSHIYYDVRDSAARTVEIRDGSPGGTVLEVVGVNPNPTILGHNISALYGLSCRNALTGTELIVYEPVYKINPAAVAAGEISDTNRNNVPDHVDNDGRGYWGYRANHLIDRSNGSSLDTDYLLDYVIAHRFPLAGVTANTEFTYREYAIERDPAFTPAAMIPGEVVHIRVGNIYHRDPDVYGEYGQFGWDGSPGRAVFFYVGNPGEPYNSQSTATRRNSGHILGVMVRNTSYATADFFGVVGTDDFNQGQGDLYFLSKQFGSYIRPRIVAANNGAIPPVTGYGLWWKYQYDRATSYGISRTKWLDPVTTNTSWINRGSFFIGNSIYSQMVYNVNCGCRGQRYDNFQLDFEASSPLNDFAIVNIGAPPWVTGGLYPTIVANTGTTVFEPNAKVTFNGNFTGRLDLLTGGGVGYRFVVLKDKFIDTGNPFDEPFLADGGKKVVDSFNDTGGYLSSPVWSYTFPASGTQIATYNVYLGIKYNYQDYSLLPYPAYSWDPIPSKDFFAWSNSQGGGYIDGQYHEVVSTGSKFGAPLRITIDSRDNLTPEHPLAITKVEAYVPGGAGERLAWDAPSGSYVASQTQKIKLKAQGSLMFLSEIPTPQVTNFTRMGGILPQSDHYRIRLGPDNVQYFADTGAAVSPGQFARDLGLINYAWYVRAKVQTYESGIKALTQTDPTAPISHFLYRGAPADMEGYQLIAFGTMDPAVQPTKPVNNLFFTEALVTPKVTLTPAYLASDPNHRRFNFTLETPWLSLPVPLDGGLPGADLRDKYEFRVAFQYKVGKWSKVTVRNYNSNILTDSYNAAAVNDVEFSGDDPIYQIERSYSAQPSPLPFVGYVWPSAQVCTIRVKDTEGPALSGFGFNDLLTSGDSFPAQAMFIKLIDNNPHDYMKRFPPAVRMAFKTGKDQFLAIKNDENLLDFDLRKFDTQAPFDNLSAFQKDPDDSSPLDNLFYLSRSMALSSCSTLLPATFRDIYTGKVATITYETPLAAPLLTPRSVSAPAFNGHGFRSLFALYDNPDRDPSIDSRTGEPVAPAITDGSLNPISRGLATFTATVSDNDPPQLRVFIQDQMDLDIMIELTGGIKDSGTTHSPRTLTIKNMKALNDYIFQATVATTTLVGPGPITETYVLDALKPAAPGNYTVIKPLITSKLPLQVFPDSRFKVTATAYDQAGPGAPVDVTLSIPDYSTDSGVNRYDMVFRRGLTGNLYHVEATVADGAGNRVILRIPLEIGAPGTIDIRTIEETSSKDN